MKRTATIAAAWVCVASAAASQPMPPKTPPHVSVITNPQWIRRPDGEEVGRYYPAEAAAAGASGRAVLKCQVTAEGDVKPCEVMSEEPAGKGFGDAALKLSALFKMRPQLADGRPVGGASITIPIRFEPPEPSDPLKDMDTHPVAMIFKAHLPAEWTALRDKMLKARESGATNADLEAIGDAFFDGLKPRFASVPRAPYPAIRHIAQIWLDSLVAQEKRGATTCDLFGEGAESGRSESSTIDPAEEAFMGAILDAMLAGEKTPTTYGPITKADETAIAATIQRVTNGRPIGGADDKSCAKAKIIPMAMLDLPPDVLGRMWQAGMGKGFQGMAFRGAK